MEIQKSSEDYLETMLMMQKKHGYIRSIDVAEHLGVTKPSVSYATKRLRESGYITMDKTGLITLEPKGRAFAREMLDRHHTLTNFLVRLGVDQETAEADACKNELDIKNEASFIEDLGADSLDTVELVMALEDAFKVQIPDEQQENLRTVQQAIDFIRANVKA